MKKDLVTRAGARCSICRCELQRDNTFIGEIASIVCHAPGGPRWSPAIPEQEYQSPNNFMLVCPNCHSLIDAEPHTYSIERLQRAKAEHEKWVAEALKATKLQPLVSNKAGPLALRNSLEYWKSNQANGNEEDWQKLLTENPQLIAHAMPGYIVLVGAKCYVGGKNLDNQGGNLVDFIYATKATHNVTLVEIKTPKTKLVGGRYRANANAMTEELSGAVVQVLNYRQELLQNFHSLRGDREVFAFSPDCLVIAGNLQDQQLDAIERRSFDHFRHSLKGITILTYDEFFGKIADLLELCQMNG